MTIDTHVFVQYKGTDICFDFYCDCGVQSHFDGYFAYQVKCPACEEVWAMPSILPLRRLSELPEHEAGDDYDFHGSATGYGGRTSARPRPVVPELGDELERWKGEGPSDV